MATDRHAADDWAGFHGGFLGPGSMVPSIATVLAGISLLILSGCSGPYSTLDPASQSAREVAIIWWWMFAVSVQVLLGVVALWLYAMFRPQRHFSQPRAQRIQNQWVIWGGLVLPTVAIIPLLVFGLPVGHRMLPLPLEEGEPVTIQVTGHQWWWQVRYPQQGIELQDEMHLPAGVPVDIELTSADVIHSFWVPRLGRKLDAIPAYHHVLRLQADEPGVYYGQCAEFCGFGHAHMLITVHVHSLEDYNAWLEEVGDE
ncbi:MAG: cytochrome c oxidase subunit II [Halomonadaceae bacterium]|nr:MAG: cytochrome c oxidase subunit II [Halomonadaceae bacterium]